MAPHLRARFTPRGLTLASGEELDLFAGSMHYWRVERRHWEACLRGIVGLGLRIVETYVPWSVHETAPGQFDFTGNRDLGAFLDLARDVGLRAIVRPGPHINAELTGWGYPERILRDPDIQARSGRGTPVWMPAPPRFFPVPSYAALKFREAATEWLRAAGEVVAPRDNVVAAQVDNEMQMFFRIGAYDADYHPDALAWWREVAGDVPPPTTWDERDPTRCLRWVAFKDEYTARSLAWVAEAMRAGGFGGVPFFHNAPPSEPEYLDVPGAEQAIGGVVGMDFYHRQKDYHRYRRRALYLAGTAATLPMGPEVGLGGPLWLPPMTPTDQENVIRGLLMSGVRGMIFFMTVLRDRWMGSPIHADGSRRPSAAFVERLLRVLERVEWTRLRREVGVAVVVQSTYARLATASSLADPITPILLDLPGFLGPAGAAEAARDERARTHRLAVDGVIAALEKAQVPYVLVDEKLSAERLGAYRKVLVPTLDWIDRGLARTLASLMTRDIEVSFGPGRPTRDEFGAPLGDDGTFFMGRNPWLDSQALEFASPREWIVRAERPVDCAVYRDVGGSPRVFFVANGATVPVTAEIVIPDGVTLTDCFGEDRSINVRNVHLVAGEVRMFHLKL